jgi:all-trans-retinol dehydrogenase (NAD+)
MKNIRDKVILVTGGASGIGRLIAFGFAAKGAKVIVWDVNGDAIKTVEDEANEKGLFIRGMTCDVSDREDVYAKAGALASQFGPVDVLVNNAGIVSKKGAGDGPSFLNTSDDKIVKIIDINVLSLFWMCKAFLPSMIERNCGHIVTISSAAGIIGVNGLADYCVTKFAAFGFDESVRMELRRMKSKVRTTVVCPFFIDTGMFHGVKTRFPLLLPILKPDYAAKKIVRAVLKNRRRLIMPRFVYLVYLLRLLPVRFLDWAADFFGISHSMDDFTGRAEG